MVSKRDWELRQAQWAAFHRWEASRELDAHPPEAALADIGAVYEWFPKDVHLEDRDPDKIGIRRVQAVLAALAQHRERSHSERR